MRVRNHRIDEIWHGLSSNYSKGRAITPRLIVTHYTTGWNGIASRDWLMGRAGGQDNQSSSAHVVVDRDGTAWQIVPFNRRAWHAGASRYGSLRDVNSHSIGIEFVNPGWLKPDGHGGWIDSYRTAKTTNELNTLGGYLQQSHPRLGNEPLAWPLYTPAQIERGLAIVRAIADKYDIRTVVTHEEIDTRGVKTDPGPAFPQALFVDQVLGRAADRASRHYQVSATRLNVRGGPGFEFEKMEPPGFLPEGTLVKALREEPPWMFIETVQAPEGEVELPLGELPIGLRGWVHSGYLALQFE